MSRIRMTVFIRNETDARLRFAGQELEHGDWTGGWFPPPLIEPGERKGFRSEGDQVLDIPTTGTQGSVRYQIVDPDGGELYVQFNSPLIESSYGNTFHVFAPPRWEVSHWGGQGHEAELEVRLRRTARHSVPAFHPHGRGFPFVNAGWSSDLTVMSLGFIWNRLWESLPGPLSELGIQEIADDDLGPITDASQGLCGGMAFTVMDYYAQHRLPPRAERPNSNNNALFRYLRERLWDSFDVGGQGHRFLGYSSPLYPNGDEGVLQIAGLARGRSWTSYREEWPRIRDDIDAGRLAPMGLIQTDNLKIGDNHQVLAYAYEQSGQDVRLFIYDPNKGQKEVEYRFNIAATDGEVHVSRFLEGASDSDKRIWGFFRINGYVSKVPPNGRRIADIKEGVRASSPWVVDSVRDLVEGWSSTGSVLNWLRSVTRRYNRKPTLSSVTNALKDDAAGRVHSVSISSVLEQTGGGPSIRNWLQSL